MAKNNEQPAAEGVTAEATAAPAAGGSKSAIVLKNGEKRADYIRRRWGEGADRSTITKELNTPELYSGAEGGKWPYQIVFQATKGQPGGPAPKTEEAAAPAEATA